MSINSASAATCDANPPDGPARAATVSLATVLFACLAIGLAGAWLLREWNHRNAAIAWATALQLLQAERTTLTDSLTALQAELLACHTAVGQMTADNELLQDRAANIALQRDHLRNELQQRTATAEAALAERGEWQRRFELAETERLNEAALPLQLQTEIDHLHHKLSLLESDLETATAALQAAPELMCFEGHSANQQVIALSGTWPVAALPQPVWVARGNSVLFPATLTRREQSYLFARINPQGFAASTLVKGEKLIILAQHHESPNP